METPQRKYERVYQRFLQTFAPVSKHKVLKLWTCKHKHQVCRNARLVFYCVNLNRFSRWTGFCRRCCRNCKTCTFQPPFSFVKPSKASLYNRFYRLAHDVCCASAERAQRGIVCLCVSTCCSDERLMPRATQTHPHPADGETAQWAQRTGGADERRAPVTNWKRPPETDRRPRNLPEWLFYEIFSQDVIQQEAERRLAC